MSLLGENQGFARARVIPCRVVAYTYGDIEKMIQKSGEFICESEVPNQIGRYTYSRKKTNKPDSTAE